MDNRSDILKELQEISGVVANLSGELPFTLPEGYFHNFAATVLHRIRQEDTAVTPPLTAATHPFHAPPGYFEHLPENILQRIKAMESSSPKDEIEALSPLLGRLNKKLPFALPQDYFTTLPEDIVSGVNAIDFVNHELETLSTVIKDAKKINVYEVPEGYFNQLSQELLEKLSKQQQGKVVSFRVNRSILTYAAAAILTGAIAFSAWMFSTNQKAVAPGADVAGIEKISDAEMLRYLEKTPEVMPEVATGATTSADMKEEDVKELLADIPDNELQQYADQFTTSKKVINN